MFKKLTISILSILGVLLPCAIPFGVTQGSNAIVTRALENNIAYHNGDKFTIDYQFSYDDDSEILLFANDDNGYNTILIGLPVIVTSDSIQLEYDPNSLPSQCDYVAFYTAISYNSNTVLLFEGDDADGDISFSPTVTLSRQQQSFSVSIPLTVIDSTHFEGFSDDALPYLTKVDSGYVPPQKNNLYRILYDFYYSLFEDDDLSAISTSYNMPFDSWICHTLTIITLICLLVILFLFLKWLFKVISGLILLK